MRLDKIPYDPKTNPIHAASTTDPTTLGAFQQCVTALQHTLAAWEREDAAAHQAGGIGLVFSEHDVRFGIDCDHCIDQQGTIAPWAFHFVQRFQTYAERNPLAPVSISWA